MEKYFINTGVIIGFNFINSQLDAYRILKNKTIAHGINFASYLTLTITTYFLSVKPEFSFVSFPYFDFLNFLFSAFFCRQITFDIPLNLRRHLDWNYVSLDKPPKALMDKIEVRIFGYNGTLPIVIYSSSWLLCIAIKAFIL